MCEIFTIIGASIATAVSSAGTAIAGASAAGSVMGGIGGGLMTAGAAMGTAATATGLAATGLAVGGLTAAGLGVANSVRNAREAELEGIMGAKTSVLNNSNSMATTMQKTASKLTDNTTEKRTIGSLRIPLSKTANTGANTADISTGLNIPQ